MFLLLACGKTTQNTVENTIRMGNGAEPGSLDPHISEGVPAARILRDLYESLYEVGDQGQAQPAAAIAHTLSKDGLVYTFKLREEAKWSNGDPVTAFDFEYGIKRSIDPKTGSHYSQILKMIHNAEAILAGKQAINTLGVKAIDAYTLQIKLDHPTPFFLGLLTHSSTYPVHQKSVEAHGKGFTKPGKHITNGAYQMAEWVVQSKIVLKKNPYYWNAKQVSIKRVEFHPIEDSNSNLKMYRSGQLDMIGQISPKQYAWVKENLKTELHTNPNLGIYYYGLNISKAPLKNNPNLRKALYHAIDREIITEKITRSGQIPAYTWIPPNINNYPENSLLKPERAVEIKKAKAYFAKSGYGPNKPLKLEILYNTLEAHKQIALAIAAMWKEVLGIEVSLLNQEWKVYLNTRRQKETTQVFRGGWVADYNDANSFLEILHSQHGLNDSAYNNPSFDALLNKAGNTQDLIKRGLILEQASTLILEDMPAIPIYFYTQSLLIKPKIKGFKANIMGAYYRKNWSLESQ